MVRYRRDFTLGATYFFTLTLLDRRSNLLVERIDDLRESVRVVRGRHPFRIDAMVVLPEHLHAIWTMPNEDADYSIRWRLIKRGFTDAVGIKVWQPRFWEHRIRDDLDYERHVDYIHWNPVKHGYVRRAMDWPHSSFHRFVQKGRLPSDWGGVVDDATGQFGEPQNP